MKPAYETVTFTSEKDGTDYTFDVQFLLSRYNCVYGAGCHGTFNEPHKGCCEIGVHYVDELDMANVNAKVGKLIQSQHAPTNLLQITRKHNVKHGNSDKTRVVNGACILLNDPSHPNGAGCSLHQEALLQGENPIHWKPRVCSWVPFSRTYEEDGSCYIGRFENSDWNDAGWPWNDWYCLDDAATFNAETALYTRSQDVLLDMLDGDSDVLQALNVYLNERINDGMQSLAEPSVSLVDIGKPIGNGVPTQERAEWEEANE
jgi:hypothetical protein